MNFTDATDYLYGLINYERTPAQAAMSRYLNLERMVAGLVRLGDPHLKTSFVHIAGTKGKGSTAAMTASVLGTAGLRCGLYTSPHLVTFRERMQINGTMISEDEFAALLSEVRALAADMAEGPHGLPTFFETLTLIAFCWFAQQQVDIAVLETGMGGRLDATNVVTPLATAITTIALDHTTELGDTLALIAGEKTGIIKPGVPVVSAVQQPGAAQVIRTRAVELNSPLVRVGEEIIFTPGCFHGNRQQFNVTGRLREYNDLQIPLLGEHQILNATVAVALLECVAEAWPEQSTAILNTIPAGLAQVKWPGRMQVIAEEPLTLIDGAHDPAAIEALLAGLKRHFPRYKRRYVLGFMADKDWPQMLALLAPTAVEFIVAAIDNPRTATPAEIAKVAGGLGVPIIIAASISAALKLAEMRAKEGELICLTGSLYAVGQVVAHRQ